jgi:hypothetical protein
MKLLLKKRNTKFKKKLYVVEFHIRTPGILICNFFLGGGGGGVSNLDDIIILKVIFNWIRIF